jgi:hypothetical protein
MVIITRDLERLEFSKECPMSESVLIVSYNGSGTLTTVPVCVLVETHMVANHIIFPVLTRHQSHGSRHYYRAQLK